MKDISKLKTGVRVHYQPSHYENDEYENGIVKEIPSHTNQVVRVVYNCAGEWDRFMDFTSALTDIRDLQIGWKYDGKPKNS